MKTTVPVLLTLYLGLLSVTLDAAPLPDGMVRMDRAHYDALVNSLEKTPPAIPPRSEATRWRRVTGRFRKGVLSAEIETHFEVLDPRGHVRVPVLDGRAAIAEVSLDGKQTSLLREGSLFTVGVDQPGKHVVKARFFIGQEQDRFARRLRLQLPEGGASELSIVLPEKGIEPTLVNGVLDPPRIVADGTLLRAHLDAGGWLDLSWRRRLHQGAEVDIRSKARVDALLTLGEAMVTGMAAIEVELLEGETDRIDLQLPPQVEILKVEGPAVLQWHTESGERSQLTVLLRYLVSDRTRAAVQFQYPVLDGASEVPVLLPLPKKDVTMRGHVGVLAASGLQVEVADVKDAQELSLRDLPQRLIELTSSPLLFGFSFEKAPSLKLKLARQQSVVLTSTIIDELQASTVLVADGSEITKLRLRMRNNTRQYLQVSLPEGAQLTHSLIDGEPIRPALSQGKDVEVLLFPLRQSERVKPGGSRLHMIQAGETLSEVANFYFGDPTAWPRLLDANPGQLDGPWDLQIGQQLRVPLAADASVEESSFVVELAYKRRHPPLARFGWQSLQLPSLDVDTVGAIWHVYLPESHEPLRFDANLTQYSAIRYDPFRRLQQFLRRAMWVRHAWAGGGYRNVLAQRKSLYFAESRRKSAPSVLAAFPLVGQRYRFKRVLLGHEQPQLTFTYLGRGVLTPLRWLALALSFALFSMLLWRRRELTLWGIAAVGLLCLALLGHYVLGVHRRIVWGADLALALAWARLALPALVSRVQHSEKLPWQWFELLRLGVFLRVLGVLIVLSIVVAYPLLLSSLTAVVLAIAWWRAQSTKSEAVQHA